MAIYDFDGTAIRKVSKIYDNNGATVFQTGKIFDNNGTTSSLIYNAEQPLQNLLTSWNYGPWTSGSDCAATYTIGSWNVAGFSTVTFKVTSFWRWGGVGAAGVQFKVNGTIYWNPATESRTNSFSVATAGLSTVTLSVTTWINVSNVSGAAIWGDISVINGIAK